MPLHLDLKKQAFFEEKTSDDQCKYMNMVQATPKIRKGHNWTKQAHQIYTGQNKEQPKCQLLAVLAT
jgi:hypothetical protein